MSTAPLEPSPAARRMRRRWGTVRFLLLLVTAVCLLVAYAGGRGGTVEVVACTAGTVAITLAAVWDAVFQRARNRMVAAGQDHRSVVDPLDSFYVVSAFAVFTAVFAGTLPVVGALRWVLLATCLLAAVGSWLGYRHHRLSRGSAVGDRA